MSRQQYSDEELERYFSDRSARRGGNSDTPQIDQQKIASYTLGGIGITVLAVAVLMGLYAFILSFQLPSLQSLENPRLDLATVAYTADGEELARYHRQNRTWVTYEQISPHAINALIATEDHRFYDHWGMDLFRTFAAVGHTLVGNRQGGSTITQQLARNLHPEVGTNITPGRKLKEMMTAIQIERNYTKREILEMYLNTVAFGNNAYGIESAARTYFNKPALELDAAEAATLIGMLKGTTLFNPVRNTERSLNRRNVVLRQMMRHDFLSEEAFQELRESPIELDFRPVSHTANLAPYFAEHVRLWLHEWARESGFNIYTDGLVVHTSIDSRMQRFAQQAVDRQARGLQAVIDVEWSRASPPRWSETEGYERFLEQNPDLDRFGHYWSSKSRTVDNFVRETERYRKLVRGGTDPARALSELRNNEQFIDSLRADKSRLEVGFVAVDPTNGHVKAWVGGRDYVIDKYDHVALARRQPGSTFKPFVYTAAIDNGYSPYSRLLDAVPEYRDPQTNQVWRPRNFGNVSSGQMVTLRDGLARSINTVTARLATEVGAQRVADYARRMGVDKSPLYAVPSIALGTSDVTLLEMAAAYATLASGGIYHEPVVVTRIEDRFGNVLAEFYPESREALSENTAYTVVDMMRSVISSSGGTGARIRWRHGVTDHDLAGKTGTTQEAADGWFLMMHPNLVTGAWVGFNDRRVTFRSSSWGQGSRNALPIVGDFFAEVTKDPEIDLPKTRFKEPENYQVPQPIYYPASASGHAGGSADTTRSLLPESRERQGRIGW